MIRVLYISHEGHEVLGSTLSLANHLHALQGQVGPLVILPAEGAPARYLREVGYEVRVIPFKLNIAPQRWARLKRIPRLLLDGGVNHRACRLLADVVRSEGIQLIHTNSSVTLLGHQLRDYLRQNLGIQVPHVWHLREFQDLDFGFQPFCGWPKLRSYIQDSEAVVAITRAILSHFCPGEAPSPRHHVLNDAVRSTTELSRSQRLPLLLFCGKVIPAKGAETALQLFAGIAPQFPAYRLCYVGQVEPDYQARLTRQAEALGLAHRVEFCGFQADVRPFMQQASALLMCSRNEAQGRVTIEAMFYGTPVLAMAAGGTLEIVQDEANGLLFDSIPTGITQLQRLLSDPSLADRLIAEAHHTASSRFSEEVYREQMLSIYRSLLSTQS